MTLLVWSTREMVVVGLRLGVVVKIVVVVIVVVVVEVVVVIVVLVVVVCSKTSIRAGSHKIKTLQNNIKYIYLQVL